MPNIPIPDRLKEIVSFLPVLDKSYDVYIGAFFHSTPIFFSLCYIQKMDFNSFYKGGFDEKMSRYRSILYHVLNHRIVKYVTDFIIIVYFVVVFFFHNCVYPSFLSSKSRREAGLVLGVSPFADKSRIQTVI